MILKKEIIVVDIYATRFSIEKDGEVKAEVEVFGEAVEILKIDRFAGSDVLMAIALIEKYAAKPLDLV
jgi:hypothetical protein